MDCMIGRPHVYFLKALGQLAAARESFAKLAQGGLILGNDNHIGDIGEYWVRRYYSQLGRLRYRKPHGVTGELR
jgi:hypothetical protein